MTPIVLSFEQAAKDFPDKNARNIVVLITDDEESFGGDPCAVYARLQADGFIMKPYVVGFALKRQEVEKVRPGRRDRGQTWPDEHSKAGLRTAGRQGACNRPRVRVGRERPRRHPRVEGGHSPGRPGHPCRRGHGRAAGDA